MLTLETKVPAKFPLEGEVWMIALDPTVGDEMQKTRRCVVVSGAGIRNLGLRVVVPITEWDANAMARRPWFVELAPPDENNGLTKQSGAACHQVRSVSLQRFKDRVGRLSADDMLSIRASLKITLSIA
jgi:mRNA interferase MazF